MSYWLFKSEPSNFSIADLSTATAQTTVWDGVRNYQARNFLRDQVACGDYVFFYHSSCKNPGIVGIMQVVKSAYHDLSAYDLNSPYYDTNSTPANCTWYAVDVQLQRQFDVPISLSLLKQQPGLRNMLLVKPGNRLSIMPVTQLEWDTILALA